MHLKFIFKKVQVKQYNVVKPNFLLLLNVMASAEPFLNWCTYNMKHILNFMHEWHCRKLPNSFNDGMFKYASNVQSYNTRYASKKVGDI